MTNVNYEIFEQIGKGARGLVFRGLDIRNKREVAIKKVPASTNTTKEINNHLSLNNLDIIPKLYDYFEEVENNRKVVYIILQLIQGESLFNAWRNNGNWDFSWATLYHVIKLIDKFHQLGITHGDLHLNNFIWTGDKMYIIDFDKIVDVERRMIELEDELINIKEQEPQGLTLEEQEVDEEYSEYLNDIFKIEMKIYDLKGSYCDDYSYALSSVNHTRLGDYNSFVNINNGYERFKLLESYYQNSKCSNKIKSNDYSEMILAEYNRIDKLKF